MSDSIRIAKAAIINAMKAQSDKSVRGGAVVTNHLNYALLNLDEAERDMDEMLREKKVSSHEAIDSHSRKQ